MLIIIFFLINDLTDIYPLLDSQLRHGVGGMSLFVGLKGTTEELGVKGQNIWAFTK